MLDDLGSKAVMFTEYLKYSQVSVCQSFKGVITLRLIDVPFESCFYSAFDVSFHYFKLFKTIAVNVQIE